MATSKSPDFPIEKYTYVKKLGDASRGGKVYLYELQESETAPELPKVVIVKTLLKKPSDEKLVILSCGNHPRIVKGAKYLVFVFSRSVKMREFSFAQFVYFLKKVVFIFQFLNDKMHSYCISLNNVRGH